MYCYMSSNQLFFSHAWSNDNLNRNNHIRVLKLSKIMKNYGFKIWIDEEDIIDDIDYSMVSGIDNSSVIFICLTTDYFYKINKAASNPNINDNCYKEWCYANARNKIMIPIIMESSLKNISNWPPGIISMYFSTKLYIDASHNNLDSVGLYLKNYLKKMNILPNIDNLNFAYKIQIIWSVILKIFLNYNI